MRGKSWLEILIGGGTKNRRDYIPTELSGSRRNQTLILRKRQEKMLSPKKVTPAESSMIEGYANNA